MLARVHADGERKWKFGLNYRLPQDEDSSTVFTFDSLVIILLVAWKWLETGFRFYLNGRQAETIDTSETLPRELDMFLSEEAFQRSKVTAKKKLKLHNLELTYGALAYTILCTNRILWGTWKFSKMAADSDCLRSVYFVMAVILMNCLSGLLMSTLLVFVEGWKHHEMKKRAKECFLRLISDAVQYLPAAVLISQGGCHWLKNERVDLKMWATLGLLGLMHSTAVHILYRQINRVNTMRSALPEGDLRDRIVQMAATLDYPPGDIIYLDSYLDEGSTRDWGTGVMALSGVLSMYYQEERGGGHAKTLEAYEVQALVAHELAHWKLGHRTKLLVLRQIISQVRIYICLLLVKTWLAFSPFGFVEEKPLVVGAFATYICLSYPLNSLLRLLELSWCRYTELSADMYARAIGTGQGLRSAIAKLCSRSDVFPILDRMYSSLTFSQPSPLERIRVLYMPVHYRIVWRQRQH